MTTYSFTTTIACQSCGAEHPTTVAAPGPEEAHGLFVASAREAGWSLTEGYPPCPGWWNVLCPTCKEG